MSDILPIMECHSQGLTQAMGDCVASANLQIFHLCRQFITSAQFQYNRCKTQHSATLAVALFDVLMDAATPVGPSSSRVSLHTQCLM